MSERQDGDDRRVAELLVGRLVTLVESWQHHLAEQYRRWGDPPALRAARAWLAAGVPARAAIGPDVARPLLEAAMSDISEKYSAAGWLHGLELLLWRQVVGDPRRPPAEDDALFFDDLDDSEIRMLRELSAAAGGWFHSHRTFIPLSQWLVAYDRVMAPRS